MSVLQTVMTAQRRRSFAERKATIGCGFAASFNDAVRLASRYLKPSSSA